MSESRWYRLGDVTLGLECEDRALRERFDQIYGECAVPVPGPGPLLRCRVLIPRGSGEVAVEFDDPVPLDLPAFIAAVFPERGYAFAAESARGAGSFSIGPGTAIAVADASGKALRAPVESAWRPFVANLAVNRALRLQGGVTCFHAASFVVRGKGVLACGPKRSGKTTLALAMAARGHGLLGDELAAVRCDANELLPVRRSLAVREGPASAHASEALFRASPAAEVFPDGERRLRAAAGAVFPGPVPQPTRLTVVLLLRTFATRPAGELAPVTPELLGRLAPLAGSVWGRSRERVVLQLLRMLSAVRVYWFDSGAPEESAGWIEHLLETT